MWREQSSTFFWSRAAWSWAWAAPARESRIARLPRLVLIVPAQRAFELHLVLAPEHLDLHLVAGGLAQDRLAQLVERHDLVAFELDDDVVRLDPRLLGGVARHDA